MSLPSLVIIVISFIVHLNLGLFGIGVQERGQQNPPDTWLSRYPTCSPAVAVYPPNSSHCFKACWSNYTHYLSFPEFFQLFVVIIETASLYQLWLSQDSLHRPGAQFLLPLPPGAGLKLKACSTTPGSKLDILNVWLSFYIAGKKLSTGRILNVHNKVIWVYCLLRQVLWLVYLLLRVVIVEMF